VKIDVRELGLDLVQ